MIREFFTPPEWILDTVPVLPKTTDDSWLSQFSVIRDTETAIYSFNYPKLGTHIRLQIPKTVDRQRMQVSPRAKNGSNLWIVGYFARGRRTHIGHRQVCAVYYDPCAELAFPCELYLEPEWCVLDDGTLLRDQVVYGNPYRGQCKCCGQKFRLDRLELGYCNRNKCSLQRTRSQQAA